MTSQYFMINNTKLTIRSGGDMGNIASQWPNPKSGPPLLTLTNSVTQRMLGGRINEQHI